jgi:hypothetical protein
MMASSISPEAGNERATSLVLSVEGRDKRAMDGARPIQGRKP